jgi:hypothetical protein
MQTLRQFPNTTGFSATPFSPDFNMPSKSLAGRDFNLGQSPLLGSMTNYTYNSEVPQFDIPANFQPVSPTFPFPHSQLSAFQMQQLNQASSSTPNDAVLAMPTPQDTPISFEELLPSSTPESERYIP